jgi:hypothetical protein
LNQKKEKKTILFERKKKEAANNVDKLQLKIRKRQRKARFHFLTFHVLGKADWENAFL